MDMNKLFEPMRNTAMPEETRRRILAGCLHMQRRKAPAVRKAVLVAAILIIALCITAAGTARLGFYRDIRNIFGAVTGTEYLNATEEIRAGVVPEESTLCVNVEFLMPGSVPYTEIDSLSISAYQVLDAAGNVIFTGTETESAQISQGRAVISLPGDIPSEGAYVVVIHSFTAYSKADAPMEIHGKWECPAVEE